MFQPKCQQLFKGFKSTAMAFIPKPLAVLTAFALIAGMHSPAFAATETPTPTSTPTATVTPTPTPTPFDVNSATSVTVVVNKTRPLNPIKYQPVLDKWLPLAVPAAKGYRALKKAMLAAKMGTLCLNSGYRSYSTQKRTYDTDVARYGKKVAENLAAHPGYSEHQTGLAADVSTTALGCRIANFGASKAAKWIAANAYKFGFIVRYPSGQTSYTGYQYEPWHLRFVSIEVATAMRTANVIVLEKFFKLPSAPRYLN